MKPVAVATVNSADGKERMIVLRDNAELNRFKNFLRGYDLGNMPVFLWEDSQGNERYFYRHHIVAVTIREEAL